MIIPRIIEKNIIQTITSSNKVIVIYGPRQVGKTTLCKSIIQQLKYKTLSIDADQPKFIDVLSSKDSQALQELVAGYDLLFIDEAQRVPEIGLTLKIMVDHIPHLKIIATGSSSFDLANQIGEPLTGRKWTYTLYPIAQLELAQLYNPFELKSTLVQRLVWGSYPEIFALAGQDIKYRYLQELIASYLYKDLLALGGIKQPRKIRDLLKLLAYQIGQEVSLNELGSQLNLDAKTVARYLDLLEKTFVIFTLSGFSRNLRKEVTKMNKYYFFDLGVRNSIIDNFKTVNDRNDVGALWENFLMVERKKRNHYIQQGTASYFWRTYTGAEIDYIEDVGGQLHGYEFKWRSKKVRQPLSWTNTYPGSTFSVINSENYIEFIATPH